MNGLGVIYNSGNGVPKDHAEARKWFEKSAAAGNEVAKTTLKNVEQSKRK
jgi:TPR repeat protein